MSTGRVSTGRVSTGRVSALAPTSECSESGARRRMVGEALAVIALYAGAGWIYIAANAVVHPASLGWPLTHLASWPHEDTFGIVCFLTSFAAAMTSRLLRAKP